MDKENLNGIPEEEIEDAAAEVQEAEETAEELAAEDTSEEIAEEEAAEEIGEEADETVAEESAEEEEERVISEEDLCPICGEREVAEGSNYCVECETKMLKRKIPLPAWLAGLWSLGFSVFALVLVLLASAPALQVYKGDSYAKKKNWYAAYTEYSQVSTVADEINSILGMESNYTKTGMGVNRKIIDSVANYSSPIDAYSVAQNLITGVSLDELSFMDDYSRIYNEHYSSYMAMIDILDKTFAENANAEEIYAELDALKGTEGVTDIYVDFYKFAVASQLNIDAARQVELLEELEASCIATGEDYGWLYYQPMAEMLNAAGENDRAVEYLKKITENDKSQYDAYNLKMAIELDEGNTDEASKTLAEFKVNNEGFDSAFLLEIQYLRRTGDIEKAKTLCTEALESYDSVPELNRQLALIYMVEGDYVNAFDSMMTAYNNAYYMYYYTNDSSTLNDPRFYNAMYLSASLLKSSGQMTEDMSAEVEEILAQFEAGTLSDEVNAIESGEKTVVEVLTKGACDVA